MMKVEITMSEAPAFIAGLVREGVTFEARQCDKEPEMLVVVFLGGF